MRPLYKTNTAKTLYFLASLYVPGYSYEHCGILPKQSSTTVKNAYTRDIYRDIYGLLSFMVHVHVHVHTCIKNILIFCCKSQIFGRALSTFVAMQGAQSQCCMDPSGLNAY